MRNRTERYFAGDDVNITAPSRIAWVKIVLTSGSPAPPRPYPAERQPGHPHPVRCCFRPGFNFQVFQSRVHAGLDAIKIADQLIDSRSVPTEGSTSQLVIRSMCRGH